MAYLEPCCIENQLPQLLRQERGSALFQTNGDVTVEKLMQAACCLASGGFGEYWIVVREVDVVLMRTLAHWIDRGWIRRLNLLTETDQRALVTDELGGERMKLCCYGWREGLASAQMLCCVGERETVVVQGEMMLQAARSPQVTAYSATVGPNSRLLAPDGIAASLIENLRAVLRVQSRRKKKPADADADAQPVGESSGTGSADSGDEKVSEGQASVPGDAPDKGTAAD